MGFSKLVFFSRNYPPLVGGIEGLMHSVFLAVRDEYDVILVGPKGCRGCAEGSVRVYELPVNIGGYLAASFFLIPYLLFRFKPALVVGSNGLMAPLVFMLAKLSRGSSVCFLHGLDIIAGSRLYRSAFLPFARRVDAIIVNSSNTAVLAFNAGVPSAVIELIPPCISDPVPAARMEAASKSLKDRTPIIVYAGRIVPRKGLLEFLQECAGWLQSKNYKLVVAGDEPFGQAGPEAGVYIQRLRQAVQELEFGDSIEFLGRVSEEQMASALARATVHVMPLVETPGDVEGFGMVAVEAASYGVPTVAFDLGGVRDALPSPQYLIEPGNYAQFMEAVDAIARSDVEPENLIEWAKGFSMQAFRPRLLRVLSRSGALRTADT